MLVSEMISDIKSQDLVLPEFQREYVCPESRRNNCWFLLLANIRWAGCCFGRHKSHQS